MASLDACLRLLQGPSDEQRFAGLLMVTKFLSVSDLDGASVQFGDAVVVNGGGGSDAVSVRRQLFDAIGDDFLKRLLKTSDGDGGDGGSLHRNLALSVISTFVADEYVARRMRSATPVFLKVLRSGWQAPSPAASSTGAPVRPPPTPPTLVHAIIDALRCLAGVLHACDDVVEQIGVVKVAASVVCAASTLARAPGMPDTDDIMRGIVQRRAANKAAAEEALRKKTTATPGGSHGDGSGDDDADYEVGPEEEQEQRADEEQDVADWGLVPEERQQWHQLQQQRKQARQEQEQQQRRQPGKPAKRPIGRPPRLLHGGLGLACIGMRTVPIHVEPQLFG